MARGGPAMLEARLEPRPEARPTGGREEELPPSYLAWRWYISVLCSIEYSTHSSI